MKKTYSKPQIAFDSFELSQNIAADCAYISHMAWQVCVIEAMGEKLFLEAPCIATPDEISISVCYDVPTNNDKVFSS